MGDKVIYIPIECKQINPSVDYNNWLKGLDRTSLELTNQNLIKVPKVL